jgi:hypothetical protein
MSRKASGGLQSAVFWHDHRKKTVNLQTDFFNPHLSQIQQKHQPQHTQPFTNPLNTNTVLQPLLFVHKSRGSEKKRKRDESK